MSLDVVTFMWPLCHDDVIKWKRFPRYWPFVRGIHRGPVNSPHKGQWRGALVFSLICVWINGWVNNREAGDLRGYPAHYDVTVMVMFRTGSNLSRYCSYHFSWPRWFSAGVQCMLVFLKSIVGSCIMSLFWYVIIRLCLRANVNWVLNRCWHD